MTRRRVVRKKAATTNRPGSRKRKPSKWEGVFLELCKTNGWPTPVCEYRFHRPGVVFVKQRQWRFDFAWVDAQLAVEIDGGVFRPMSGHRSPTGITSDRTKDAVAQIQGWIVLRFTEMHFREGLVEPLVVAAFDVRGLGG